MEPIQGAERRIVRNAITKAKRMEQLVLAAVKVRERVANANVIDPIMESDRAKWNAANGALTELCQALDRVGR